MSRIHGILSTFILSLAATVPAQNLITNPGFESSGSGWTLWTDASASESVSSVTYPDSGARSGTRYARVEVTTPSVENWHIQFQTPAGWEAVNGATYDMTFWAKSENSSSMHFSVQDGPDNGFTYRTGFDFALSPEWTEYSFSYISDVEGTGALRFFLYVGSMTDIYGFDDFNLTMTPPAGILAGSAAGRQGIHVHQGSNTLAVTLDADVAGDWSATLYDLRGVRLASVKGRAGASLSLPLPRENGAYFIRAASSTQSWMRKVIVR